MRLTAHRAFPRRRSALPRRRTALALGVLCASLASGAGAQAEAIAAARYEAPVARYGHFAPGRPHEYARVVAATDRGRSLELQLPEDEVFEDVAPRLVRLAASEAAEILAIVSRRDDGSRLAMIRLHDDRLEVSAQSPAIGVPMRWLNPVGVADLDGDGRSEIAIVTTPHIGGTLRVYRRSGSALTEIAALAGFSNHVYGSPELGLSTPMSVAGRMRLLVPDATRRHLRIVALEGGRLVEVGRCALPSPAIGAIEVVSPFEVSVGLAGKRHRVVLRDCLPVDAVAQERFVSKLALPAGNTAVVAEGDFEARSTGSFSVRLYGRAAVPDETTFFTSGLVRTRDGVVEKAILADIDGDRRQEIVVIVRSVGTGSYLSAHAFAVAKDKLIFRAEVKGLAADADPVAALRRIGKRQK